MHSKIACYISNTLYIQYLHIQNKVKLCVYRDTNVHNVNYSIFIFSFLSEAADVKIDQLEDIVIDVVADVRENGEIDVAKSADIDRWQGEGYVMPKKSGLRNSLIKLFSSCFKANKKNN